MSNIHIIPLVAMFSGHQEIEGGSVFVPDSPKQLSFENRLMSD